MKEALEGIIQSNISFQLTPEGRLSANIPELAEAITAALPIPVPKGLPPAKRDLELRAGYLSDKLAVVEDALVLRDGEISDLKRKLSGLGTQLLALRAQHDEAIAELARLQRGLRTITGTKGLAANMARAILDPPPKKEPAQ
jgi:hypothetical protein